MLLTAHAPSSAPTTTATSAATSKPSVTGVGASGCVAGQDVTVDALLSAQKRLPATPTGAAAFAGLFQQFTAYAPTPSAAELTRAFNATTSGDIHTQELAAVAKYGDQPGGAYGDGKSHRLSLAGARYYIESATTDQVVITLAGNMIQDSKPQLSSDGQQVVSQATVTLKPTADGWVLTEAQASSRTYAELQSIGTPYAGGC